MALPVTASHSGRVLNFELGEIENFLIKMELRRQQCLREHPPPSAVAPFSSPQWWRVFHIAEKNLVIQITAHSPTVC